jgi:hypothetical protein
MSIWRHTNPDQWCPRVLQLAYTACICQGAYTLSVTDFGQIFALLYTPWGLNLGVVVG